MSVTARKPRRSRLPWIFLPFFVAILLAIFLFVLAYFLSPTNVPGDHVYYSPLPPLPTAYLFRIRLFLRGWSAEQVGSLYKIRSSSNPNMIVPPEGCATSDVMDVQIEPGRDGGSFIYVQAYPVTVCE